MAGAFQLACPSVRDQPKIAEGFASGAGVGWHEHNYHADSIDQARKRAAEAGVADRCRFEVASAPDGTWTIVEPAAGDRIEDNLNPVGRVFEARP